jgi:hypothetical protein
LTSGGRELLAGAANQLLRELYHDDLPTEAVVPIKRETQEIIVRGIVAKKEIPGGIDDQEEEQQLANLNEWVTAQNLPAGHQSYELVDPETSTPLAILDLAWPNGLQEGYSQPVAVLLNEGQETLEIANTQGYRYFTQLEAFKEYVTSEIVVLPL